LDVAILVDVGDLVWQSALAADARLAWSALTAKNRHTPASPSIVMEQKTTLRLQLQSFA
jgi:hypothetical protein